MSVRTAAAQLSGVCGACVRVVCCAGVGVGLPVVVSAARVLSDATDPACLLSYAEPRITALRADGCSADPSGDATRLVDCSRDAATRQLTVIGEDFG